MNLGPIEILILIVLIPALVVLLVRSESRVATLGVLKVLGVVGIVLLFLIIALPFYQSTREAARRDVQAIRLRAIGESLHQTHVNGQNTTSDLSSDDPHEKVAPSQATSHSEVKVQYEGRSHSESRAHSEGGGHAEAGGYVKTYSADGEHNEVNTHIETSSHAEAKSPDLSAFRSTGITWSELYRLLWLLLVVFLIVAVISLSRPGSRSATLGVLKVLGVVSIVLLFGYLTLNQTQNLHIAEPPSAPPGAQVGSSTSLTNITTERPDWVDKPAVLDHGVYRLPVKSGPYVSQAECQHALEEAINQAAKNYLDTFFGDPDITARIVSDRTFLHELDVRTSLPSNADREIDSAFLQRQWIKQPIFAETLDSSVGPMQQLHALLEFDDNARAELRNIWRQVSISNRLRWAAGGFAMMLAILGAVYVNLRFAPTSGGSRGRRLLWAAALAILLMTAGAMVLFVA